MLAEQPVLHVAAVRPQAVLQQRGLRHATSPGSFATVQCGHDRGIQSRRGGVVAHAGHRADRFGLRRGPHHVHQPSARPVGGRIEAGAGRLRSRLAVGRDRAVDQPRIDRQQVGGGDLQALAHRRREVGDEDVGRADQPIEDGEALGVLEIDRQALLVAGCELPPVVGGLAGDRNRCAPRIAGARRLELDHLGAEIGEDRGRRGPRDPARAVDDFQAVKYSVRHRVLPLLEPPHPEERRSASRRVGSERHVLVAHPSRRHAAPGSSG